ASESGQLKGCPFCFCDSRFLCKSSYFCAMLYPVLSILSEVKEKLSTQRVVILEAPPGAGKSTVLPLHLLKESWLGDRKIILLEPRRLAARSVAMRMAELH